MSAYKRDVMASATIPRHYNARFVALPDLRLHFSNYLREVQKGVNYAIQVQRRPTAFLTKAFADVAANREISESVAANEFRNLVSEVEKEGTVIRIKMPSGIHVDLKPVPTV